MSLYKIKKDEIKEEGKFCYAGDQTRKRSKPYLYKKVLKTRRFIKQNWRIGKGFTFNRVLCNLPVFSTCFQEQFGVEIIHFF